MQRSVCLREVKDSLRAINSSESPFVVLCLAVCCLRLYVRANWTGPPTKGLSDVLPPLLCMGESETELEIDQRTDRVREELCVEGEFIQELVNHAECLFLAHWLICDELKDGCVDTLGVWKSRVALTLQRSLTGGRRNLCVSLRKKAIEPLVTFLKSQAWLSEKFSLSDIHGVDLESTEVALSPFGKCHMFICTFFV